MKKCSILKANSKSFHRIAKYVLYILSIFFWITVWHVAAIRINKEIFLPTPKKVLDVLFSELMYSKDFRISLLNSISYIGTGFLIGTFLGVIMAILSSLSQYIDILLWLPIKLIKTVPVASFVILSLLWFDSESLSIVISTLVVMPIIYINTKTGIKQTNDKLLCMAKVYNVSIYRRFAYIYIPSTIPYLLSACSLAIGMAWKAGIAAEIIGLTKNSIGNELYKAKLYLMIPELFAWTIVIVALCMLCEFFIKLILGLLESEYGKN